MNQPCFCTDPSTCEACPLCSYRARDARITIGLPIKQDNEEWEYPGYIDGVLIAFYATPRHADLALNNILDAEPVAILPRTGLPNPLYRIQVAERARAAINELY